MTGVDEWLNHEAVLVRTTMRPDLSTGGVLDVRPGAFSAFDGDRFWTTLRFNYDDRRRRSFGRTDLEDAFETATAHVRDGGTVRLGNRARLRHDWSKTTIRALEQGLAQAASEADGTLLAWTDGSPGPDDEAIYDVVVRQ